ncbi:hypothetical protein [Terrabacter terrigena]|uniref:Uncharacterized protein n=1 Tax=Terrabacter terrigena TaxID=574718 RepID=A0ABW3MUH6_9MICO
MSNESTNPGPAEQRRPSLPQFDPNAPETQSVPVAPSVQHTDDTQLLPAAPPTGELPVTPPSTPYAYAGTPASTGNAPIADSGVGDGTGRRWSAKKTAVTAGLAIVLAAVGAIGAAAAVPAGSTGGDSFRGPGGGRSLQFPGGTGQGGFGQQNPNGQQLPNLQNGVPGGGLGGLDPNPLSQLDPQDLLKQLDQNIDPFSGGSGSGQGSGRSSGTGGAKST